MYKVFGDLFGTYIYNSNINEVTGISEEMFNYLKGNTENKSGIETELSELNSRGFLSDKPHEISYPIFDFEDSLYNRGLSNAVIQLTQNCNFRCDYCNYSHNDGTNRLHNNKHISWDILKDSIDYIHRTSIDSNDIVIGFYGGEPFLEFNLMKKAILYSNELFKGKSIMYSVTTNASLITDEMLNFLNNYNVSINISIDGSKKINDQFRKSPFSNKSSYDGAKEVIEKIHRKYKNLLELLSINMVLIPSNDYKNYLDLLNEIPELEDVKIISSLVSCDGLNFEYLYKDKFTRGYEYANFINRLVNYSDIQSDEVLYKSRLTNNQFNQKIGQIKSLMLESRVGYYPAGPCMPVMHKIFIDTDGQIYVCEKISENTEDLIIGNIYEGIDHEKVHNIIKLAEMTKEECRNCWAFNLCSSCVKYCVDKNGISRNARLNFCENAKSGAEDVLYDYVSLVRGGSLTWKRCIFILFLINNYH